MKKPPLGFVSTPGIIGAVLAVLIVAGFAIANDGILFSPGALNAQSGAPLGGVSSHAEIADQCSLCHVPFWSTASMADRCVVCHTDVAVQLLVPAPLHGVLRQANSNLACRKCHPEHGGPDAPLTIMVDAQFPHNLVGYSLAVHQRKSDGSVYVCRDCHAQGYTSFDQSICSTCHTQMDATFLQTHSQEYGNNCLACHDGVDTYGDNFNHTNVPYPLTGGHVQVACTQCHINARSIEDLKSTPQDCAACHAATDPHQGRYGSDCSTCHTTAGWVTTTFDHNLSTFKLIGKHASVACESCHIDQVFAGTPTDCNSCHQKDDKHNGQYGTDCAACHTADGWLPASLDHNLFAFQLTGAHINVACLSCHINNVFKGTPSDCNSCHQKDDTHNGQFGTNCEACHTTSAWLPATFDHSTSGFPLTGAHVNLTCTQCHTSGVFSGLSTACVSCHAQPADHAGTFGTDCAQCHNTSNWNASFNHPGGCDGNCATHRGATCADCHPVNYSTYTCSKCHDRTPGEGGG